MIKINGVVIPAPSDYGVAIQDISNAERNAKGTIIIERIATKRKISMTWQYLSSDDLSNILTLVSPVFFCVEYIDPQDNGTKSGTFYSGDRNSNGIGIKNGKMHWKDTKFDLIER